MKTFANKSKILKLGFLLISDFLILLSLCFSVFLINSHSFDWQFIIVSLSIIMFKIVVFAMFGVYKIILSYFGLPDMFKVLFFSLCSSFFCLDCA